MGNYTLSDVVTVSAATGVFALFALVPGYTLGWALDLLGFRQQELPQQLLMSTPLSIWFVTDHQLLGRSIPLDDSAVGALRRGALCTRTPASVQC
jgi:hypothetical protein